MFCFFFSMLQASSSVGLYLWTWLFSVQQVPRSLSELQMVAFIITADTDTDGKMENGLWLVFNIFGGEFSECRPCLHLFRFTKTHSGPLNTRMHTHCLVRITSWHLEKTGEVGRWWMEAEISHEREPSNLIQVISHAFSVFKVWGPYFSLQTRSRVTWPRSEKYQCWFQMTPCTQTQRERERHKLIARIHHMSWRWPPPPLLANLLDSSGVMREMELVLFWWRIRMFCPIQHV